MSTLFDDLDPDARQVWGNDMSSDDPDNDAPKYHIVGPRLPRTAPTSWRYLAPCGYLLWGDSMIRHTDSPNPPKDECCRICVAFLEQRGWAKRNHEWPA